MTYDVAGLLAPETVVVGLGGATLAEAWTELAGRLRGRTGVVDWDRFLRDLNQRQGKEPTILEPDVALPHVRTDAVREMVVVAGTVPGGIGQGAHRVRLVFLIGTPTRMATEYLAVVGGLARRLKQASLREALAGAGTPEEFLRILRGGGKGG